MVWMMRMRKMGWCWCRPGRSSPGTGTPWLPLGCVPMLGERGWCRRTISTRTRTTENGTSTFLLHQCLQSFPLLLLAGLLLLAWGSFLRPRRLDRSRRTRRHRPLPRLPLQALLRAACCRRASRPRRWVRQCPEQAGRRRCLRRPQRKPFKRCGRGEGASRCPRRACPRQSCRSCSGLRRTSAIPPTSVSRCLQTRPRYASVVHRRPRLGGRRRNNSGLGRSRQRRRPSSAGAGAASPQDRRATIWCRQHCSGRPCSSPGCRRGWWPLQVSPVASAAAGPGQGHPTHHPARVTRARPVGPTS
mmetsp:Transcript_30822/g.89521  ORF Transcript_30822/g.89521 Transcript_30822/m.89521 type:complete len:302 (-) Transcript_30822:299-1204(-)